MTEKQKLRKLIAQEKKSYTSGQLAEWSSSLFNRLEDHPLFQSAQTILMYYSLPDEVQTHDFVEKWHDRKRIVLPVVKGDDLELRYFNGKDRLRAGMFGIGEPSEEEPADENDIELAIIPGVAFDREGNRLGRGKGYYDRTLERLEKACRIGVCFSFQILDSIPTEECDRRMDEVWTEKGRVSKKQCRQ